MDFSQPGTGTTRNKLSALATVWIAIFMTAFFSLELPNNPPARRWQIWLAVPDLLDFVDPPHRDASAGHAGWQFLPQRFDLLAVAAVILAGAWGAGHLVLRIIRPPLPIKSTERTVFAFGTGLAVLSLATLAAGLGGELSRPMLAGVITGAFVTEFVLRFRDKLANEPAHHATRAALPPLAKGGRLDVRSLLLMIPFVPFILAMLLGSLLPSTDFDVNEYHFEGPKEYFQAGRISFLEHNVYTSFPFGTEMLTLLAMVLRDDWFRGALAGKGLLMCFGPLTALALFAAGRRWFGTLGGLCAAFLYLATPWTYRISTIAYAEGGVSFYLFATFLAVMAAYDVARSGNEQPALIRQAILVGILAGSAMSCKYPALVSVVAPMAAAVCALSWSERGRMTRPWVLPLTFVCGVLLTVGPWLLKNAAETGNPVYPLEYRVFGGRDWDAALDARWTKAHHADNFAPATLIGMALDVAMRSDWVNPLLFALAPLALIAPATRQRAKGIWLYIGWLFFSCWLFTHRIDRFWVPMLPVVAVVAGGGAAWWWSSTTAIVRLFGVCAFAAMALFNLASVTRTGLGGYNDYLRDLDEAGHLAATHTAPEIVDLNERLTQGSKVLAVGDAEMFYARFPVSYNTVFDRSIFEEWFAMPSGGLSAATELRSSSEIREKLAAEGVTHIYVNWLEVLRYRSPGNYGYTDFVAPERFAELQRRGILGPAWPIPEATMDLKRLDANWVPELETWGRSLITRRPDGASFVTFQVFPVAGTE
jgi:4-amino-4-deoxy-L-arabinose transferase-like glycosyltransferase